MRKFINIIEASVVDFGDAKRKRDAADQGERYTQDEKYRGAGALQASGLTKGLDPNNDFHNIVRDFMQDAMTTWAAGRELDDEQRERAKNLSAVMYHANRIAISAAMARILRDYSAKYPDQGVVMSLPDHVSAYMKDDPVHAKYRLLPLARTKSQFREIAFDDAVDLYAYVVGNILPHVPEALDDKPIEKFLDQMDTVVKGHAMFKHEYDGEAFDPDKPQESDVSPYVLKFLASVGTDHLGDYDDPDAGKAWIGLSNDRWSGTGTGFTLSYHTQTGMGSSRHFATAEEADTWIKRNMSVMRAWYDRQNQRKSANQTAVIRYVQQAILIGIKAVLDGKPIPPMLLDHDFNDKVRLIENEKLEQLFSGLLYDLRNEPMRKFFEEYHLTWLPERVQQILAEEN